MSELKSVTCAVCGCEMTVGNPNTSVKEVSDAMMQRKWAVQCRACGSTLCLPCVSSHRVPKPQDAGFPAMLLAFSGVALGHARCPKCDEEQVGIPGL